MTFLLICKYPKFFKYWYLPVYQTCLDYKIISYVYDHILYNKILFGDDLLEVCLIILSQECVDYKNLCIF